MCLISGKNNHNVGIIGPSPVATHILPSLKFYSANLNQKFDKTLTLLKHLYLAKF